MLTNADKSMLAAIGAMVGQVGDENMRTALQAALRGEKPTPAQVPDTIRQEVLSGDEAAHMLGLTRRTVTALAKQGHLQTVKVPGRVRGFGFTRASIEALMKGGAA